jgi:hypothetical protein
MAGVHAPVNLSIPARYACTGRVPTGILRVLPPPVLAVQIIATGFSGLRLLRQSQQHMTEEFIDVYGNYAIKLLRLQNDLAIGVEDRRPQNA